MPIRTTSNERAGATLPASRRRRRYLALAALGMAAIAACSGRERARQVDADLGHDLDLASTTGIELANRGGTGTQVVSAIEESPRSAPRQSAARTPKSMGHRRHKIAKPRVDAPEATVMVADHEAVAAATTEPAAGPEPAATAPAQTPDPGPAITPEPVSYPAGGGTEAGRGQGGGGGVVIGIIGAVLRGGMGGVDRCDERHGRGRHGGGIGGVMIPMPGGGGQRWPSGTFPRY